MRAAAVHLATTLSSIKNGDLLSGRDDGHAILIPNMHELTGISVGSVFGAAKTEEPVVCHVDLFTQKLN